MFYLVPGAKISMWRVCQATMQHGWGKTPRGLPPLRGSHCNVRIPEAMVKCQPKLPLRTMQGSKAMPQQQGSVSVSMDHMLLKTMQTDIPGLGCSLGPCVELIPPLTGCSHQKSWPCLLPGWSTQESGPCFLPGLCSRAALVAGHQVTRLPGCERRSAGSHH
jgi:hypothetical protein